MAIYITIIHSIHGFQVNLVIRTQANPYYILEQYITVLQDFVIKLDSSTLITRQGPNWPENKFYTSVFMGSMPWPHNDTLVYLLEGTFDC